MFNVRFVFPSFGIRICFDFRNSNFGFCLNQERVKNTRFKIKFEIL